MRIDNKYKLWYTTGDHTRPTLSHVLVARIAEVPDLVKAEAEHKEKWLHYGDMNLSKEGNGVAVATDGFVLSIVPVVLDETDVSGLVSKDIFRYVLGRKRNGSANFDLSNPVVTWSDGLREGQVEIVVRANGRFYPRAELDEKAKFPNFIPVLPDLTKAKPIKHVTLNFSVWNKACKAIGSNVVRFFFFGARQSVLFAGSLTSHGYHGVRPDTPIGLKLPFAIVMPMHSDYDAINDEPVEEKESLAQQD